MSELSELATDLAEVVLDSQLDDGIIREIPIIGSAIKLAKTLASIPDRLFLIKVKYFLDHANEFTARDSAAFAHRVRNNPELFERAGSALLFTIDALDDTRKCRYLAAIYVALLYSEISDEDFRRLCHAVSSSLVDDLDEFIRFMTYDRKKPEYLPTPLRTLVSSGLAYVSGAVRSHEGAVPFLTPLGTTFYEVFTKYS